MLYKNRYTPQQALAKAKHFCAWQERCHQEVKDKLYSFGLHATEVDRILATLIEENYLNEERFAIQYVGGKFRMKKWGRIKILTGLKTKRISPYIIKIAMKEIDEGQYNKVLVELVRDKWDRLKREQYLNRQAKTMNYLLQKGFESQLISEALKKVRAKE